MDAEVFGWDFRDSTGSLGRAFGRVELKIDDRSVDDGDIAGSIFEATPVGITWDIPRGHVVFVLQTRVRLHAHVGVSSDERSALPTYPGRIVPDPRGDVPSPASPMA